MAAAAMATAPTAETPAPQPAPEQAPKRRKRSFTRMILGDTFVDEPSLSEAAERAQSFESQTEGITDSMIGSVVVTRTSIPWVPIVIGILVIGGILVGMVVMSGGEDAPSGEQAPTEQPAE